jgi:hypothetical protein
MWFPLLCFIALYTWMAGLSDWVVAFATAFAQLGVWITLASLVPAGSVWVMLKKSATESGSNTQGANWTLSMK